MIILDLIQKIIIGCMVFTYSHNLDTGEVRNSHWEFSVKDGIAEVAEYADSSLSVRVIVLENIDTLHTGAILMEGGFYNLIFTPKIPELVIVDNIYDEVTIYNNITSDKQ